LLAYDVVSFASRAAKAIEELMEEGHIVAQWGSLSDALDSAKVAENDATLEFAAANVPFPLKQPRCLAAAPASDPMGGEGNRGRVARTPHMSFANAVTREILYASMPPRDRREIHLDVVGVLKSDAAHAEDILGDLAAAACLNDEAAYHLEVVQRIDRAALESAAHSASFESGGGRGHGGGGGGGGSSFFHRGKSEKEKTGGSGGASELGGSGGASPSRSRRPSVGGVSASSGNSVSSDLSSSSLDAGPSPSSSSMRGGSLATVAFKTTRELSSHRSHGAAGVPPFRTFGQDHVAVRVAGLIAAANGLRARVQCHENAAKAHLRHGGARAALTSVSAAGVAASTWVESSHALQKAFGKSHPEAVASATLGVNDTRCLLLRNAAWAILASRMTLDLGECVPPFLLLNNETDARAPLRCLRRAADALALVWPFRDRASRDFNVTYAREQAIAAAVHDNLPKKAGVYARGGDAAFERDAGGFCGCIGSIASVGNIPLQELNKALDRASAHLRRAPRRRPGESDFDGDGASGEKDAAAVAAVGDDVDPHGRDDAAAGAGASSHSHSHSQSHSHAAGLVLYAPKGGDPHKPDGFARDFQRMSEMEAGVADVLAYAEQIRKSAMTPQRLWMRDELALVVASDLSTTAVFAGRLGFACQAILKHVNAFVDCRGADVCDAALLLNTSAAVCTSTQRAALLLRAKTIVVMETSRIAREEDERGSGLAYARGEDRGRSMSTPSSAFGGGGGVDSESSAHGGVRMRSALLACRRRRVRFAEKAPPPRSGPAMLMRAYAECCQGDWVVARGAAAAAVALMEKDDHALSNARLCDLARCLGATAYAHLGHWESALAAATALAEHRRRHAEIGPWILALRMASMTAMKARSIHWFPYDRVGVVNADP
jgi:hypothetical protein